MRTGPLLTVVFLASFAFIGGCAKNSGETSARATPAGHEHRAPHGGTAVVLGDGTYHLEFVREADAGKLQAFIFDDEMDNFIRAAMPSFRIMATVEGKPRLLVLNAVANPATGETVGDSALFETQADWLKSTGEFDATVESITIRGTTYSKVRFNFPKGNDQDK